MGHYKDLSRLDKNQTIVDKICPKLQPFLVISSLQSSMSIKNRSESGTGFLLAVTFCYLMFAKICRNQHYNPSPVLEILHSYLDVK